MSTIVRTSDSRPVQCLARCLSLAAALLLALGLSACDRKPASAPTGSAPPLRVVCTTGMIADAARAIGGDHAQVVALMGEGVDPHLYKPTPGDIRELSDAQVIFYNGLLLEGRMVDVLVKMAAPPKRFTVAVTEHIDHGRLREPEDFGGHADPHVWFDVSLWARAAERIRDAYIEADPAHRDAYTANAASYLDQLAELHAWCHAQIATIPKDRRVLITAHDAFGYFGAAYDIEVLAIQGVSTDSEASVKQINQLVDTIVSRKINAVFIESSVSPKTIEALVEGCRGRGHTVKIGGELFSDAMGAAGTPEGTYVGMVRHNVQTIVSALKPSGSGGEPK